jgi:XrtJ-associated TM-motif-TM protein
MKKSALLFVGFALLLCIAVPLHAQDGCTDSPENPTAILALVGSGGALLASVRARIKARRRQFITGKQPDISA